MRMRAMQLGRRLVRRVALAATLSVVYASAALAQSEKLFAAPTAPANAPASTGSMAQATLALAIVLIAIFAAAFFMRKLRKIGAVGAHGIEIVSQVALGAKERAVLIKVAGAHVLVGVAANSVNLLHVLDANAIPPAPLAAADVVSQDTVSFKSILKKSLGLR